MTMRGWIAKLDDFPRLGDRDILQHAGRVSADMAKIKAQAKYDKWHDRRLNQPGAVDGFFQRRDLVGVYVGGVDPVSAALALAFSTGESFGAAWKCCEAAGAAPRSCRDIYGRWSALACLRRGSPRRAAWSSDKPSASLATNPASDHPYKRRRDRRA
ncbi:hypothetical protein [Brevundimonas phoenicis]